MTDRTEENKEFVTNELDETKEIPLNYFKVAGSLDGNDISEADETEIQPLKNEGNDTTPEPEAYKPADAALEHKNAEAIKNEDRQPLELEKSKLDEETVEQLVENRFVANTTKPIRTNPPVRKKKRKKHKKSNFALTSLITFLSFILVFVVFFVVFYIQFHYKTGGKNFR